MNDVAHAFGPTGQQIALHVDRLARWADGRFDGDRSPGRCPGLGDRLGLWPDGHRPLLSPRQLGSDDSRVDSMAITRATEYDCFVALPKLIASERKELI